MFALIVRKFLNIFLVYSIGTLQIIACYKYLTNLRSFDNTQIYIRVVGIPTTQKTLISTILEITKCIIITVNNLN